MHLERSMQWICDHFYWLILLIAVGHLFTFALLERKRRLQAIWLADHLENLLSGLSSRADRDPYCTVDERIDSFLANVREVLDDPARSADRRKLHDTIVAKDETKKYLRGSNFETLYSVARTSIEMYPLLGIMGTVLAIALALNAPPAPIVRSASRSSATSPAASGRRWRESAAGSFCCW